MMQYTSAMRGSTPAVRATRPPVLGGPAGGGSPRLSRKVAWGAHFDMGVDIRDALRRSESLGVRVVEFSREVRAEAQRHFYADEADDDAGMEMTVNLCSKQTDP